MQVNRIQNKVAASSLTLPVATVLATLGWLVAGGGDWPCRLGGWALCFGMVYLLEEMNNCNSLIRIRTRLTAAIYIVGAGCCGFLQEFHAGMLVAPAVLGACYLLFRTYQQYQPVGGTFHAFLCLGCGMLVYPRLLLLALFFFFCMAVYLRTFTCRTFKAGLVGLLLPFWFAAAYTLYVGETGFWEGLWEKARSFHWPGPKDYGMLAAARLVAWGGLTLFSLVAIFRYLHTNYGDKIRNRMLFYILILLHVLVQLGLVAAPWDFDALFGLLWACSAPLLAHFYALTHTRVAALLFVLMSFWFVSLFVLSLWIR